ncbi:MAG: hypothetical protein WCJ84_06535, partial [Candidatus Peregrinibacteria bacterium]
RISAGTTKTYIVELNVSALSVSPGIPQHLSVQLIPGYIDTAFSKNTGSTGTVWSDFSDPSHSATPSSGKDWFTGYKLDGILAPSRTYSSN